MPTYSHSSLSTYVNCPFAYKLRYLYRLERTARESIEAFMGSRVHEALEKLYTDLKYTKLNSLGELLAYYHDSWNKNWHNGVLIVREGLAPGHYTELGARCIAEYYNRFAPFNQGRVVGIEKAISLPLDEAGEYKIRGFIDRVDYVGEGVYEVHDYKTSGSLMTQEYADNDRQLALYQMAVERMYADANDVRLIWHYLAFNKDVCSRRTPEQLQDLRASTIGLIQEIGAAKTTGTFPAREGLCNYCDFPAICPRHRHEHEVVALTAREFKEDEGVILVDRFASLKEQLEDLGVRVVQARNDLLAYSVARDAEVIIGSGRKVNVNRYSVVTYPRKNDHRYEGLVEVIRTAGKWEEVSALDSTALKDAVKQAGWPKDLIKKV